MAEKEEKPKKQVGGRREGSGRKPGQLGIKARTILEVKNRIAQKADELLNAELVEALGSFVVMKADPETGEYSRVTDEKEIVKFIQQYKGAHGKVGNSFYVLAAKDGNYKSRQYLFDRAFGRPSHSVEVSSAVKVNAVADEIANRLIANGWSETDAQKQVTGLYPEISNAIN